MSELKDLRIQLSLSVPPDHLKLAIPARELDRAMLTVCMTLVRAGATVVYGGDLRPDGFTFKIFRHLASAYADQDTVPFIHVLNQPSLSKLSYETLAQALRERRGTCQTYLPSEGKMIPIRLGDDEIVVGSRTGSTLIRDSNAFDTWSSRLKTKTISDASTDAREAIAEFVHASVLIGGKMGIEEIDGDLYVGKMPGIIEEALMMLKSNKPVIPLGAYGGATRDLAVALGLLEESQRVPRGSQTSSYSSGVEEARRYNDRIPPHLRSRLTSVAQDDRAEFVAKEIVQIISQWRNP
ncbi:hypothetical protein DSM25558_3935 [Agrobacterium sp. DSM 25558]|uniref:hypothetical protein n=1 Tax=Agrobacterium sp. DSM 25558 TaxID=1907665 RepID=UPI0009724B09|nr:hypothetical protein [Agrobacterium sp. DSM 25558]SCX26121.1 hypothetical protein DSM25558_3935 [Agrobacterium sp. DSM 25558]